MGIQMGRSQLSISWVARNYWLIFSYPHCLGELMALGYFNMSKSKRAKLLDFHGFYQTLSIYFWQLLLFCNPLYSTMRVESLYHPNGHLSCRDSGNDFVRFSVPFLEGRISNIRAACNYPTRNTNLKSRISDIRLKSIGFSFLTYYVTPSHTTRPGGTRNKKKLVYHLVDYHQIDLLRN